MVNIVNSDESEVVQRAPGGDTKEHIESLACVHDIGPWRRRSTHEGRLDGEKYVEMTPGQSL